MKVFFLLFIIFSPLFLNGQSKDLIVVDGIRYKGKLINYSKFDIRDSDSGEVFFYVDKIGDTLKISSNRNLKIKINRFNEFYKFDKETWNKVEYSINFDNNSLPNSGIFFSKGFVNDNLFNLGIGSGIFTIDRINFIPIFFSNHLDFYPNNRNSIFKLFIENKIGYSLGYDLGFEDYISASGGSFFNPSFGIKKSTRNKHISLKIGYLVQKYKSEHNNFWWGWWGAPDIFIPGSFNISDDIISRNGFFKQINISVSLTF